jgi:hypothetical protein
MKKHPRSIALAVLLFSGINTSIVAQNPLIRNMYSADPSARVFGDSVYLYPSHDILATPGHGRIGWFCMEDYHVYASADLTNWKDDGIVVSQYNVPWVKPDSYSMWAPDCIYRNGKYYFYFPTTPGDSSYGQGFAIGVAVADHPTGPFVPQPAPIANVHGIDPNVFIDKDGQAYLYWSQGNIFGARLKENMLELASDPIVLGDLPAKGLKEGPYLFERDGRYYLTFPHVENKTERLEYAMSKNPLGPFKWTGVIMDESPTGCWTNHHSIIRFKDQWYLFYHHNDYSPGFDKARSVRADSLFFNGDGTIRKVVPSLRGIGITQSSEQIQVDRYSAIGSGASIVFLDSADKFRGWKTIFEKEDAWIQYNTVAFGKATVASGKAIVAFAKTAASTLSLRAASASGATLVIRTTDPSGPTGPTGPVIAEITIPPGSDWGVIKKTIPGIRSGIRNLVVQSKTGGRVELDWISFE